MKRSNLLLGLTTGFLAIASFAFSKAHRSAIQGFCTNKNGSAGCTVTTQRKMTITAAGHVKAICVGSQAKHNATAKTSLCQVALYTTVNG